MALAKIVVTLAVIVLALYCIIGVPGSQASVSSGFAGVVEDVMTASNSVDVGSGCKCANYSCGCCGHVEEDRLKLNATVCVNLTYLSQDIGISLTATVNDHTFLNRTISVRNPPAICVETPYIHAGSLCVLVHDIDAHLTSLHACVAVEAMLKHVTFTHVELGCFTLGGVDVPRVRII